VREVDGAGGKENEERRYLIPNSLTNQDGGLTGCGGRMKPMKEFAPYL